MNIQRTTTPTTLRFLSSIWGERGRRISVSDSQGGGVATRAYDLEERLLEYSARIIRLSEQVDRSMAGLHVAQQLMRSGTSALANHGEAQSAESPKDFVHKLKLSLKELRETYRWLRLVQRVPLIGNPDQVISLLRETDELIRIFVASIRTSQNNSK